MTGMECVCSAARGIIYNVISWKVLGVCDPHMALFIMLLHDRYDICLFPTWYCIYCFRMTGMRCVCSPCGIFLMLLHDRYETCLFPTWHCLQCYCMTGMRCVCSPCGIVYNVFTWQVWDVFVPHVTLFIMLLHNRYETCLFPAWYCL